MTGRVLVTGASGQLGGRKVERLLSRMPASDVVALARDPARLGALAAKRVEVRASDYLDDDSLLRAFEGVEKVMLVSAPAFTDRMTQHGNVVTAAKAAGVHHIVYTAVMRRPGSRRVISHVSEADLFTEKLLAASGVSWTIAVQPPFLDGLLTHLGDPLAGGLRVPHGTGSMTTVTRDDLAEAQAVILTTPGHENRHYLLSGEEAITFADMARMLGEALGRNVPLVEVSGEEWVRDRTGEGLPEVFARFALEWMRALGDGEFAETSGDFRHLVGREPIPIATFLAERYARVP